MLANEVIAVGCDALFHAERDGFLDLHWLMGRAVAIERLAKTSTRE
jgi:hypothetical protein